MNGFTDIDSNKLVSNIHVTQNLHVNIVQNKGIGEIEVIQVYIANANRVTYLHKKYLDENTYLQRSHWHKQHSEIKYDCLQNIQYHYVRLKMVDKVEQYSIGYASKIGLKCAQSYHTTDGI